MHRLDPLLETQDGVVTRRQVLACGADDDFLARAVRRRELVRVVPGVYVDHTGPLTWDQRAWTALLHFAPAALSHESALRVEGLRCVEPLRDDDPVHVAVDHGRRLSPYDGVVVHRKRHLDDVLHPSRSPCRVRLEEALLDVASAARSEADAVALLADACQERRTTPARLHQALVERTRLPRRPLLERVLADVADGAYSLLEQRYLTRVERPHGLPSARRQRRVRREGGSIFRDVEYAGLGVVVELDGRLGHDRALDRWRDLDRDLAGALDGNVTLRLGWSQVMSACRSAGVVGAVLRGRGWSGAPRACSAGCEAVDRGVRPAPGA